MDHLHHPSFYRLLLVLRQVCKNRAQLQFIHISITQFATVWRVFFYMRLTMPQLQVNLSDPGPLFVLFVLLLKLHWTVPSVWVKTCWKCAARRDVTLIMQTSRARGRYKNNIWITSPRSLTTLLILNIKEVLGHDEWRQRQIACCWCNSE